MKSSINLMSLQIRRKECIRVRLRQWTVTLATLATLLGLATAERYWAYRTKVHRQLTLEAKYEPLADLKTANKSLARQIEAIRNEEQFVLALSNHEPAVTLLGVLSEAVVDSESRVFLQKIELNNVVQADAQSTRQSVLELAGIANSGPAVKQFAETLQHSLSFGKIDITSTKEYRLKQQLLQDFSLQCNF
ncbi:MAG: PilN domain-containing protein [Bythopirellula sp.]|nr:PilN domain-containing protein [Bythopirellula sp.]